MSSEGEETEIELATSIRVSSDLVVHVMLLVCFV